MFGLFYIHFCIIVCFFSFGCAGSLINSWIISGSFTFLLAKQQRLPQNSINMKLSCMVVSVSPITDNLIAAKVCCLVSTEDFK